MRGKPQHIEIKETKKIIDAQKMVDKTIVADCDAFRRIDGEMIIHSQAGTSSTDQVGDLESYPEPIWYDPNGIANILSLASVKKYSRVTYDSNKGNAFIVHLGDNRKIMFKQSNNGLFFHDVRGTASIFVLTVKNNKKLYTRRDVKRAEQA